MVAPADVRPRRFSVFLLTIWLSQFITTTVWAADCPRLSTEAANVRITGLSRGIRHHNVLYYQKNSPEISDAAYDRLFAELVQLETCFPALAAVDSPTRRVGAAIGGKKTKIRHDTPMLSLASATGPQAVEKL